MSDGGPEIHGKCSLPSGPSFTPDAPSSGGGLVEVQPTLFSMSVLGWINRQSSSFTFLNTLLSGIRNIHDVAQPATASISLKENLSLR